MVYFQQTFWLESFCKKCFQKGPKYKNITNLRWWWWGVLTDVPVQDDGHDHTRCRRPKAAQQWYGPALETVAALCNRLRTSIEAALSPDERRQPGPPPPVARCRNLDGGPTLHILRT